MDSSKISTYSSRRDCPSNVRMDWRRRRRSKKEIKNLLTF